MKVRVYTDYDPIRIFKSFDPLKADIVAQKSGLSGNFVEVEESEIPKDRTNRHVWKHIGGKIEIDQAKVQAKFDKDVEKQNKKSSILAKLKITEQELAELIKG